MFFAVDNVIVEAKDVADLVSQLIARYGNALKVNECNPRSVEVSVGDKGMVFRVTRKVTVNELQ